MPLKFKVTTSLDFTAIEPDLDVIDTRHRKMVKQMAAGAFNHDYTPNFTTNTNFTKQKYRAVFGPFFVLLHTNLPGIGVSECKAGISRLIALREPSKPGYSAQLANNQCAFFTTEKYVFHLERFRKHFHDHVHYDDPEVMYDNWLNTPHPKRKMRLQVDMKIKETPHVIDKLDPIQIKLKHGEMLAPGKMRVTADLGVYRTQLTAYPFNAVKVAWAVDFDVDGMTTRFVKSADQDIISKAFHDLWEGPDVYIYHSDDGCVGVTCLDGRLVFNDDIKACDCSHRTPMFEWLLDLLLYQHGPRVLHYKAIQRAFDYLREPIEFHNPENFKEKVIYFCRTMRLYSGSTTTTVTNNLARLMIGIAFRVLCPNPRAYKRDEVMKFYVQAGELAGYILKIQVCEVPQDMQFLKHSCTFDYRPYMNLGTVIRGFGSFRGDLPGTGCIKARAYKYNCSVVEGRKTWGDHVVNRAFAQAFPANGEPVYDEYEKTSGSGHFIPTGDLCARYKCTYDDLDSFAQLVSASKTGECHNSFFADWLYTVDYTGIEPGDTYQKHYTRRLVASSA